MTRGAQPYRRATAVGRRAAVAALVGAMLASCRCGESASQPRPAPRPEPADRAQPEDPVTKAEERTGYEVGEPAPDIALPSIHGGEPMTLAALRGKKVLLLVFASW